MVSLQEQTHGGGHASLLYATPPSTTGLKAPKGGEGGARVRGLAEVSSRVAETRWPKVPKVPPTHATAPGQGGVPRGQGK